MKLRAAQENVPPENFRFEKIGQELPEDAKSLAAQARSFDRDVKASTSAAVASLERILGMLEGLPPQAHEKNARLIQAIESKYLLDPVPKKPKEEANLLENAGRLVRQAERASVGERDRYFALLRRMAKTHAAKLKEAKQQRVARVQPKVG
jgi:hypothetical protein